MTLTDIQIIETVRSYECLFNNKIKDYKNAPLKQIVWEEISSKLKMPVSECKTKWNQLRNAFLHALSRRKTVAGQGVKNFKKWRYEEEMSFLLPYMVQRDTVSNFEDNEPGYDIGRTQDQENSNGDSTQQRYKRKVDYHEEILQMIEENKQRKKIEKDEIDLLFESMAKAVKQLPKLEQIKVKFAITKTIYEAQMLSCQTSEACSTSSISSASQVPSSYTHSPPHIATQSLSHHSINQFASVKVEDMDNIL